MSLTLTRSVSSTRERFKRRTGESSLIADDVIDLSQGGEGGWIDLRGAAGDHDVRVWDASRRDLRIACLAWRTVSDVTAHVLTIIAWPKPAASRMIADDIELIRVQPAAEGDDLNILDMWRLLA